jgi:ABC-type sulfate transport system permease subunit
MHVEIPLPLSSARRGLAVGLAAGRGNRNLAGLRTALAFAWAAAVPVVLITLASFDVGIERVAPSEVLPLVDPDLWSGLLLTLVLAVVSIVASFPVGVCWRCRRPACGARFSSWPSK